MRGMQQTRHGQAVSMRGGGIEDGFFLRSSNDQHNFIAVQKQRNCQADAIERGFRREGGGCHPYSARGVKHRRVRVWEQRGNMAVEAHSQPCEGEVWRNGILVELQDCGACRFQQAAELAVIAGRMIFLNDPVIARPNRNALPVHGAVRERSENWQRSDTARNADRNGTGLPRQCVGDAPGQPLRDSGIVRVFYQGECVRLGHVEFREREPFGEREIYNIIQIIILFAYSIVWALNLWGSARCLRAQSIHAAE